MRIKRQQLADQTTAACGSNDSSLLYKPPQQINQARCPWPKGYGLPAKSGVSGGLIAVVNRQIGIGQYSPRLDNSGNSIRATKACIDLAEELGLHAFEFTNKGSSMLDFYI